MKSICIIIHQFYRAIKGMSIFHMATTHKKNT